METLIVIKQQRGYKSTHQRLECKDLQLTVLATTHLVTCQVTKIIPVFKQLSISVLTTCGCVPHLSTVLEMSMAVCPCLIWEHHSSHGHWYPDSCVLYHVILPSSICLPSRSALAAKLASP